MGLSPLKVMKSGLCVGCGSCAGQTDFARMKMDGYGFMKPDGPSDWLKNDSELLARTCPFSPGAANEDELAAELYPDAEYHQPIGRMLAAYVGAVSEPEFREKGSSGGMVSWVLAELLSKGLIDGAVHVRPVEDPAHDGRFFRYRISRTEEDIRSGAKSRYYPVELAAILREIRNTPGRYAVVGVPCFIKAVQLLRRQDPVLKERIAYTLGLFCGHMKSARMIESFAWQMGTTVEKVKKVDFRIKDLSRPASTYTAQLTLYDGTVLERDWWNMADGDWGAGFFQNSACNYCDDVIAETADISFGDAWVEPYSSDGRGTNVIVVRSPVLHQLVQGAIAEGRIEFSPVDSEFVRETQAAGFRQRREGLAYRLTWPRARMTPRKRVQPTVKLERQRRLIYIIRSLLSAWSHRMFWVARKNKRPMFYTRWATMAQAAYHGLAYSRGKLGQFLAKVGLRPTPAGKSGAA